MDRILTEDQLKSFDVGLDPRIWAAFNRCLKLDFPAGDINVLDVGGGMGRFADQLLGAYPHASVTVLDFSQTMLSGNRLHVRKRLVQRSATEIEGLSERFDVICFNWVLHHLVGNTHAASVANINRTLRAARSLLTPSGRISVNENPCDGIWIDALPGRLIYELSSASALAPVVRVFGGNTAGTGVCFRSQRMWRQHFADAGLSIVSSSTYPDPLRTPLKQALFGVALHLRQERAMHFWLS